MSADNETSENNVSSEPSETQRTVTPDPNSGKTIVLEKGQEYRLEVDETPVSIKLLSGLAESFGTELRPSEKYEFKKGSKVAVFTFHGCKLRVCGEPEVDYVSSQTPMTFYVNLGNALEGMRVTAERNKRDGPNVLITGPVDVGKSTLCRILLNYSVRYGRTPVFVDLDVGQGALSIPGNIAAMVVEKPSEVDESFQVTAPIVYHLGHTSPGFNERLYEIIIDSLASAFEKKKQADTTVKYSGSIINTCGWVTGAGYQAILKAIKAFNVDVVLVIDQEKLFNELNRDHKSNKNIKIILTPKSGGVVARSRELRTESRDVRTREYFYGQPPDRALYPFLIDFPFDKFHLYKVGAPELPNSCLPLGMKQEDTRTKLSPLTPTSNMVHNVLAMIVVPQAQNGLLDIDHQSVINTNVTGFVAITNVDSERQIVTVLSPQPKQELPKHAIFLLSDVEFVDLE